MKRAQSFTSALRPALVVLGLLLASAQVGQAQVCGCTDPLALNYDPTATINDGGCVYATTVVNATTVGPLDSLLEGSSSLIWWDNGFWTFNDHSDSCLYHLDATNAAIIEALCINGIYNYDIEEISQDSLFFYLGDVGNNNGFRQDLHILRIGKDALLNQMLEVDTIWFSYEDQTDFSYLPQATDFDCEAFVVSQDSIYLFTKQWVSMQTTIYALPKTPGTHVARKRATYDVDGLITGATYLPEYRLVALCGYEFDISNYSSLFHPFLVLLYDFQEDNFFSGNKRRLDLDYSTWAQVEAIATHNALDFYLTNERFTTTLGDVTIDLPALLRHLDLRDYMLPYLTGLGYTMIQPHAAGNFHLYPNPATDRIHLDCPSDCYGAEYTIFNVQGQKVMGGVLNDNTIMLNDHTVSAGIYLLVLQKKDRIIRGSFVKKE